MECVPLAFLQRERAYAIDDPPARLHDLGCLFKELFLVSSERFDLTFGSVLIDLWHYSERAAGWVNKDFVRFERREVTREVSAVVHEESNI